MEQVLTASACVSSGASPKDSLGMHVMLWSPFEETCPLEAQVSSVPASVPPSGFSEHSLEHSFGQRAPAEHTEYLSYLRQDRLLFPKLFRHNSGILFATLQSTT